MTAVFLLLASVLLLLLGHLFRILRWEQFIRIYERPMRGAMLRGMAGGYAVNFLLPFHIGDIFRAWFTGRRMKNGVGFALATVIMDRFLDVWLVTLIFGIFRLTGASGVADETRYYLAFSAALAVALVLVVVSYVYITRTKQGYEIAVVGESANTARYAGIRVGRVMCRTMFLSGALCGLVGMLQFAGADYTLTEGTAGGVGFTAITVAWLSKMNPFGMLVVSVFIAMLERGSNTIQTNFKIPASASDLIIGIILFFMLGCEFFITYKLIPRRKEEHHA